MGIQPCEIEFDRFLLLIGEQASGKSTIAKLIYFFQSLPDAIYKKTVSSDEEYSAVVYFQSVVINEFLTMFGLVYNNFSFEYHYNSSIKIQFGLNIKEDFASYPTSILKDEILYDAPLGTIITDYRKQLKISADNSIAVKKQLINDINYFFDRKTPNNNYLIAGRNNVVAYSEYFEGKMKLDVEKLIEDEVRGQDLQRKLRTGNEKLLLEFVNWSSDIRKYFQNNGGSFQSVKPDLENKKALSLFEKIFTKILKGEYKYDSNGEYLKINEQERVQMKDASSGQQEVLRILQGLFLSVGLKNRKEFFVVEEPEAHLYPLAQKELINAFALFLNTIKEGRLIITTHSPYILACVNILLFAYYVARELPENTEDVLESVEKEFWLDSKMFSAYSLGHDEEYCKNIKDADTGLIDQNYLDLISEQLGLQYHYLYNLLIGSHA
jgi:predicted ATP-dependent endonuclease of OLD family